MWTFCYNVPDYKDRDFVDFHPPESPLTRLRRELPQRRSLKYKPYDIPVDRTSSQTKPPSSREGDRIAVEGVTLRLNVRPIKLQNKEYQIDSGDSLTRLTSGAPSGRAPFGECKSYDVTIDRTSSQTKPPSSREGDHLRWWKESPFNQMNVL